MAICIFDVSAITINDKKLIQMGLFDFLKSKSQQLQIDLSDLKFISDNHIRYQDGKNVSGENPNCWRGIRVQNNITGKEGYTVTMYNLDGNHPVWNNNIQMAPKQMKIVEQTNSQIKLRGYGVDSLGNSFADYGITLSIANSQVEKFQLHMFDRATEIVYLKADSQKPKKTVTLTEIQDTYSEAIAAMQVEDYERAAVAFEKALALKSASEFKNDDWESTCYFNLGGCLQQTNRLDEAITSFKKALIVNRDNADAYESLAICYLKQGTTKSYEDAIAITSEGEKLFPTNDSLPFNKGYAYFKLRNKSEAIKAFKRAIELGNPEARHNLELISMLPE